MNGRTRMVEKRKRSASFDAGTLSMQARMFDRIAQSSTDDDEKNTWYRGATTLRLVHALYVEGSRDEAYVAEWITAARMMLLARDDEIHAERAGRRP